MSERFLVIEITGEPGFQKTLCQSGWSGRDYPFFYNRHPDPKKCSHIRAYRSLDIYLAERVDMHKAANVWPLMPNFFTADEIEPQCWTTPLPEGPADEASADLNMPSWPTRTRSSRLQALRLALVALAAWR